MKPAPFDYYAPSSREEALALLAEHAGDAKPLAGGQSLVPSMNFRLAQPSVLVDLNGVSDLFGIAVTDTGLKIGAMTRQRTLERSALVQEHAPLLAEAMPHIAHPQIRNRGTLGGSLAHADPAAELPAVMLALNGRLRVQRYGQSTLEERLVAAEEFFLGLFTTSLEPDELLVEIEIPALAVHTGTAFEEFSRRHGDYALAGVCAVVTLGQDGMVSEARLVLFSVGDVPIVAASASSVLVGESPSAEAIEKAVQAIDDDIDPQSDIHATADYRRHLAKVLACRALTRAVENVREG